LIEPGRILHEAWTMYRTHWRRLIPVAFAVYVPLALITLLVRLADSRLAELVNYTVLIIGAFWLQGALVEAINDVRDAHADFSVSRTLDRVGARAGSLGAAGLLAAAGIALGTLAFIVPGLVLLTWWIVVVPVLMLERAPMLEAFARSRRLVRGHGWQVFGVIALTILVLIVFAVALTAPFIWVENPVALFLLDVVTSSIAAPFAALAWTLTYYRLRELRTA
jgi:hypothetical protein